MFQIAVDKGLKANEWVSAISSLMGGKGGGKAESAQASGSNFAAKDKILSCACQFAEQKLGLTGSEAVLKQSSGAILHCPSNSQTKLRSMVAAVYGEKTLSIVDDSITVFRDGNIELTNTTAITYYLASQQMRGDCSFSEAQVWQWLSYADNHIHPAVASWVHLCFGTSGVHISPAKAKEEVINVMKYLDAVLLLQTYFVGERISLADVVVFTTLLPAYVHVLDAETRKPFVNVNRWFSTILHQPQVLKVVGSVKLCEKAAQIKKSESKSKK